MFQENESTGCGISLLIVGLAVHAAPLAFFLMCSYKGKGVRINTTGMKSKPRYRHAELAVKVKKKNN